MPSRELEGGAELASDREALDDLRLEVEGVLGSPHGAQRGAGEELELAREVEEKTALSLGPLEEGQHLPGALQHEHDHVAFEERLHPGVLRKGYPGHGTLGPPEKEGAR
jgi:hypothetical protein